MSDDESPKASDDAGAMAAPDQPLIDALVQASFLTMGVLNRVAAAHDLSLTQLRVLAILRDRTTTVGELAGYLGLDKSTVSGLVARGEARGLLQRKPNPHDHRGVLVSLTAIGHRVIAEGVKQVATGLAPTLNRLDSQETSRLTALLMRLF
ncbi:MarR family winged helix-turn-helix transcriptional regulator [Rudaeicoccus suwonensis]|uniref:DNA-binding MarR family transcriptional regulator n=1 Tax=Rudaeicoccus suwonensis TaxID=657409 RepID=A0A561EBG9_9MICO|nr:MarR family transcriptional regulator [Rudaeicoccus suwonensis]TWE12937.1 DNA-binding MarR family transcriptional regulator [Rudaeicoccus suwonensis]